MKSLMLIKTFLYFAIIMYCQYVVILEFSPKNTDFNKHFNHHSVFLLYEVLMFYFNILALMFFLLIS